jgi:hypothetical protein
MLTALALSSPARAQSPFEVSGAVTVTAGFDAGGKNADLTSNPAVPTAVLTVFQTQSRVGAAPGALARASFFITSHLAVEGVAEYSRPSLHAVLSHDIEGAADTDATTMVSSYAFLGSLTYEFGGRLRPFVVGGAGRLRQLDETNIVLVTGAEWHTGGGVKYRLNRHWLLRGEADLSWREHAIAFDDAAHVLAQISGGLGYRF